eukprot:8008806-Alexandrium_andersonii.AAC.1
MAQPLAENHSKFDRRPVGPPYPRSNENSPIQHAWETMPQRMLAKTLHLSREARSINTNNTSRKKPARTLTTTLAHTSGLGRHLPPRCA